LLRRCPVGRITVVAVATWCLIGTGSLALADEALKSETGHIKGNLKTETDAMKGDLKEHKKEMKGPITEYREKMKAQRHEMMENMKAHRQADKANPTTPAPTTAH